MCGIAGMVGGGDASIASVQGMTEALRHRGPDGHGVWSSDDRRVVLGHRRLAVLDLSERAAQPMRDAETGVVMTYNGELYNFEALRKELETCGHSFRSSGDTEVVLRSFIHWGDSCWKRFDGMFAMAVFDPRTRVLTVARDRLGEKPLYVMRHGRSLAFASELTAIALLGRDGWPMSIDASALDEFLAHGYVRAPRSIVRGVRKVLPGQRVAIHVDTLDCDALQYWRPPDIEPVRSSADSFHELESVLQDAVASRLVADVPVGILLSGGLDSSLITAMAARARADVNTFTITFPGSPLDESARARRVASAFGTIHHELPAESTLDVLLGDVIPRFDEPLADSSVLPTYLVSKLIRHHAPVALGGDGADELFGGYLHYQTLLRRARVRGLLGPTGRAAVRGLAGHLPIGLRGRAELQRVGAADVVEEATLFDISWRRRLIGRVSTDERVQGVAPSLARSDVRRAMAMDVVSYLPDDILVKVDRSSMLNSLELRAPFLAPAVVELASKLPDDLVVTTTGRKVALRAIADRVLPDGLDLDRKQGFSIPINDWLRTDWRELARDTLSGDTLVDRASLTRLLDRHDAGAQNGSRIFAVLVLELWRRDRGISL